MRELVLEIFTSTISPFIQRIDNVAVVGGSTVEPEVLALQKLKEFKVHTFGIEDECEHYMDLNIQIGLSTSLISIQTFDLVLCSQVLEHVFDVKHAIQNLANLTKEGGIIWIACPASNRSHGSPHYYSAGYQPELITKIAEQLHLKVINKGVLGSKRQYFFTHALRVWPNEVELRHPITKYDFSRYQGGPCITLLRFIRDLPGRLYSCFISNKISQQIEYATETYVCLQRM